ncbi:MAG TPA: hypothetical protein VKA46_26950 [Gemmataceae bacterium]|nr:hypothetical protein [Gemmataceae bacterium]
MRESLTPYVPSAARRPVDVAGAARAAEERAAQELPSATWAVPPAMTALLRGLKPGQRIKITQTVRVGRKSWPAVVTGTFRGLNYLATGLATDRVPEDDIVVIALHFTKDNGELSSITLDEQSQVEVV